jgi:hypothetical protein
MYLWPIRICPYFINPIGVPSCHGHPTERYHWRQYTEADNSFSDPESSALGLMAVLTNPD